MAKGFEELTERPGDPVSEEQIARCAERYGWAAGYCKGHSVLEVACGAGQGLGCLAAAAEWLVAGDLTFDLLDRARRHYGDRIPLVRMDAQRIPIADASLDVVILFEAIYYLTRADQFASECWRVLRAGGRVLVATANKDLYDFHPSPLAKRYYGVVELGGLFGAVGFRCRFFGGTPVDQVPLRQRMLRPVKRMAVAMGLIPKTLVGRKWLKRIVFGSLYPMPAEIVAGPEDGHRVRPIAGGKPDRRHKVIYLEATKPDEKGGERTAR